MERIQALSRYPKAVLLVLLVMVLVFSVAYPMTIARVGYEYQDTILVPSQENGGTVYSGKIRGTKAVFTVSPDKTVTFQYGSKTYGPYTAREDATAIPEDEDLAPFMTGVELRKGEEILFRGGVLEQSDYRLLYSEDRSMANFVITVTTSLGETLDENGNPIDPMEPSVSTILDMMGQPELTYKGKGLAWLAGVFFCAVTAITILFAEELFYWKMSFRVQNPEQVEPSEWELADRYISWTVMPVIILAIFILGLQ